MKVEFDTNKGTLIEVAKEANNCKEYELLEQRH